ncbi:MAG: hypothetical protein II886_08430 [Prevotella sp.]|nr:hypothetical protein [Prevotella sp.]
MSAVHTPSAYYVQDAHHATTPLAASTIVPLRSHEMPREPYRLIGGGSHRREHDGHHAHIDDVPGHHRHLSARHTPHLTLIYAPAGIGCRSG